ncbi:hypothetical protein [Desulforamulus hydrothermalis]|uniref:Rubrerythrin diiron-binding domain-containing protein n=1 Tax=Desulforamulus hydrothermalis Lam5 = DSM 18033 TaxID=1121428 RepID=K8EBN2_9FIRM|nr:hypothetical protein [Desulforamulus hydrothermalis]CCO09083.1 conserved hypothetical protein [Desulforamulus hydrothermalis Lam5 = DSM 18033]SHG78617.1 hypothetical protein SAMN02745177_00400 [Desulforamulus hydrothermalis Lam5 = DSM 18033]
MDSLELLSDALEDKIKNQMFYNDAAIRVRNPSARQLFLRLRDEEMKHIEILQKEVVAIENKPFTVTKILARLKS